MAEKLPVLSASCEHRNLEEECSSEPAGNLRTSSLAGKGPLSGQDKSRWLHNWLRRETVSLEMDPKASSPQKHAVKGRSKSTEEIQQAKKAFHTPQKSLPSTGEESNIQDSAEATEENSPKARTKEGQTQN